MKRKAIFIIALFIVVSFISPAHAEYTGQSDSAQPQFVNNQVIVKYKDNFSLKDLNAKSEARKQRAKTLFGKLQNIKENVSMSLQGVEAPEDVLEDVAQFNESVGVKNADAFAKAEDNRMLYVTNGAVDMSKLVKDYEKQPEVEFAQPNYLYHVLNTPNDTNYDKMWSLKIIRAPEAWDSITDSSSVLVADIDSGIDLQHPDLKDNLVEFKNMMRCADGDTAGHGTHTAGTIGAVGNNGAGTTGVNWKVKLLAIKVGCTGNDISSDTLSDAIDYAVSKGAKVMNMSLGGPGHDSVMSTAIANAAAKNVVVVAAAGNTGKGDAANFSPGSDPNVIAVSATGPRDEFAHYSTYGSTVDISAPGGDPSGGSSTCKPDGSDCILSTYPSKTYRVLTGTSMAAPHVTGLVALMFAKNPNLTFAQVKDILERTAVDLGPAGYDPKFGAGRIDAKAAIDAVTGGSGGGGGSTPTPATTATPTPPTNTGGSPGAFISVAPTSTPAVTESPTNAPTPDSSRNSGGGMACPGQKTGDYNCNGAVDKQDFITWVNDFKLDKNEIGFFEFWRNNFLH